ncbi:MAG: GIY-YIG nuclease family protein [Chthoniobacterales bacterium]
MRDHDYWVYILTNKRCTTLYIGIANNISRRLSQHRHGAADGFTKRYHLNRIVWLDLSDDYEQQPKFYDRRWATEEMI